MKSNKNYKNIRLFNFEKIIGIDTCPKELFITDGKISNQGLPDYNLDLSDCIISPGFIDTQVNGLGDFSFWDINKESFLAIDNLRIQLAHSGIVAFCPTFITNTPEKIINSINILNEYIRTSSDKPGAKILGIHIEGVFITQCGVHEKKFVISDLSPKNLEPFLLENVLIFTLAPELDKTGAAIKLLQKNNILVSIGHTSGSYRDGLTAICERGVTFATHMFNAMRGIDGFNHRDEKTISILEKKILNLKDIDEEKDGIMLALFVEENLTCSVIPDSVHVHPKVVDLLCRRKKMKNISFTSDIVSEVFFNNAKHKNILGGGQMMFDQMILNMMKHCGQVSDLEDILTAASKSFVNLLHSSRKGNFGSIVFGSDAYLSIWNKRKNQLMGTIIGQNVFLNF